MIHGLVPYSCNLVCQAIYLFFFCNLVKLVFIILNSSEAVWGSFDSLALVVLVIVVHLVVVAEILCCGFDIVSFGIKARLVVFLHYQSWAIQKKKREEKRNLSVLLSQPRLVFVCVDLGVILLV